MKRRFPAPKRHARFSNRKIQTLRKDESGSALLMSLFVLTMMLITIGVGVDILLSERERVRLQTTLDNAVLAAADLDQELDAQFVVEDHFAKAGLSEFLTQIAVSETFNSKQVEATAIAMTPRVLTKSVRLDRVEIERYLRLLKEKHDAAEAEGIEITLELQQQFEAEARLEMQGANTFLMARANAMAEERVSDIEVALVVDVSGSMGWNGNRRLNDLKDAAEDFFDLVGNDGATGEGITSVSIVPYNHTVSVGADLLAHFTTTQWHTASACIRFRDADFQDVAISPDDELERVGHFVWGYNGYSTPTADNYTCVPGTGHRILPYETDISAMKSHINSLSAGGATASDIGMKWAAALLDPALQPVVETLVADGTVSNRLGQWPQNYDADNSMKVIVLMTDGENTDQFDLADRYKAPDLAFDPYANTHTVPGYTHVFPENQANRPPALSPVYYSQSWGASDPDDGWIVYLPNESYNDRLYRPKSAYTTNDDQWYPVSDLPEDAIQQTWQDLWLRYATRDAAYYFLRYSDPNGYWYYYYGRSYWYGGVPPYYDDVFDPVDVHDSYGTVDDRLRDICDAVRLKNVAVFSIAFEAPSAGVAVMQYCASTAGNFYDVDGTDLSYAFTSIANQINHLRLVQ